jgi:hypothetical protein
VAIMGELFFPFRAIRFLGSNFSLFGVKSYRSVVVWGKFLVNFKIRIFYISFRILFIYLFYFVFSTIKLERKILNRSNIT